MNRLFLFLLVSFSAIHCHIDDQLSQTEIDKEIILKYIADHDLNAISLGGGLYYVNEETGTGKNPNPASKVQVAYRGYLTDGKVFDQSESNGITFGLNQVIQGWTMGIPFFKEGGRGKLIIPSELAYGNRSRTGIPANSVLIFDIHLIDVL